MQEFGKPENRREKHAISAKYVIIPCIILILCLQGVSMYYTSLANEGGEAVSRSAESSFSCALMKDNLIKNTDNLSRLINEFSETYKQKSASLSPIISKAAMRFELSLTYTQIGDRITSGEIEEY